MVSFNDICKEIKNLKIQGAENVAKAGLKALSLKHDKNSIRILLSLRPTEPLLKNCIFRALAFENIYDGIHNSLFHLDVAKENISKHGINLIRDNTIIFTHCHSSSVMNILIEAKKQGKKFKVYSTETRPLFQGRRTAKELIENKIPVIQIIDSAARHAIKKADIILFGADAITDERIYNKIGSELYAIIAKNYDIPIYIATDSWKFDYASIYGEEIPVEERNADEIWKNRPKGVQIENPAFEKIHPTLIDGIVSEIGILDHKEFIRRVISRYPWIKNVKF
uniref:R15P Isomerase n=1 Tax=uncultured Candidatus Pacearchaeota archaeon TaxID=2109283 RepID=A0A447IU72_9ARCH|nr:R15P Isomerase [uncultured Candidatus Pacearchaeota archaeon]